jgi:uncharacterized protein (DUF433 family)
MLVAGDAFQGTNAGDTLEFIGVVIAQHGGKAVTARTRYRVSGLVGAHRHAVDIRDG